MKPLLIHYLVHKLLSVFWLLIFKGSKKYHSMLCCYCQKIVKLGHFPDLKWIFKFIAYFTTEIVFTRWKLKSLMHCEWVSGLLQSQSNFVLLSLRLFLVSYHINYCIVFKPLYRVRYGRCKVHFFLLTIRFHIQILLTQIYFAFDFSLISLQWQCDTHIRTTLTVPSKIVADKIVINIIIVIYYHIIGHTFSAQRLILKSFMFINSFKVKIYEHEIWSLYECICS